MSIRMSRRLLLAASVLPGLALAHSDVGHAWHVHGWGVLAGWLHPFTGVDHLLAMLALGIWAGQTGGRGIWMLPAGFLICLLAGGMLGVAGGTLPAVEPVILLSLLAFGLLVATAVHLPGSFAVAAAGALALFHGVAHGVEVPPEVAPVAYGAGFMLSSAALHLTGIALASGLRRSGAAIVTRLTGAGIAATGVLLLVN